MAEKKCISCAMMIPEEAKRCPHCRKSQGLSKQGQMIALGVAALALVGWIMASVEGTKTKISGESTLAACLAANPEREAPCIQVAQSAGVSNNEIAAAVRAHHAKKKK